MDDEHQTALKPRSPEVPELQKHWRAALAYSECMLIHIACGNGISYQRRFLPTTKTCTFLLCALKFSYTHCTAQAFTLVSRRKPVELGPAQTWQLRRFESFQVAIRFRNSGFGYCTQSGICVPRGGIISLSLIHALVVDNPGCTEYMVRGKWVAPKGACYMNGGVSPTR